MRAVEYDHSETEMSLSMLANQDAMHYHCLSPFCNQPADSEVAVGKTLISKSPEMCKVLV